MDRYSHISDITRAASSSDLLGAMVNGGRPARLAPNDLQLQQCEPLQDLRVALAPVGCAQDRFRDALNMGGMDGLGK